MELDYVKLKEIKPLLGVYIRESRILLKSSAIPDERAVHDIRVLMKKSRAVLKLAAPQLDKAYIDRNISDLRKVGRIMCSWREAAVYRKTLKELKKEYPEIFLRLSENESINRLLAKQEPVTEPGVEIRAILEEIDSLLNKTSYRIRFQSMRTLDPHLLLKELDATYTIIADVYLQCRNNPKPRKLHEFRKRAKDFLYQLYIFRSLNPSVVKALENKLLTMTQNLGKFNDLDQLVRAMGYNYIKGSGQPASDELIVKIREKQDNYLKKVWSAAYQVFCPGQKLVNVLGFKLLVI
jgi:CHAD domain-containing protein